MRPLLWGLGLFLAVWALHVALWRVHRPAAGRRLLFPLFLGALVPGLAGALLAGRPGGAAAHLAPAGPAELALFALLHAALSLAYLALYVALEGDSPTLTLAGLIEAAGPAGIEPAALRRAAGLERHVRSRLERLVTDGMAAREGERFRLTPKGRRLVAYYALYGRLSGGGVRAA